MSEIIIRDATPADAELFGPALREADKLEVELTLGSPDMADAVLQSMRFSVYSGGFCKVALYEDAPVCIWGYGIPDQNQPFGIPWFLATDLFLELATKKKHLAVFIRKGKEFVERMHEKSSLLYNYVSVSNTVAIRWLHHLGFKVTRTVPYGAHKAMFHEVIKQRST